MTIGDADYRPDSSAGSLGKPGCIRHVIVIIRSRSLTTDTYAS